jgi:L-alanine-DL-glutamate epimerase-like enolase superfamily enzyme
MKITKIEMLRTREFENVVWVSIHTDAGIIGLGETVYGAGAVASLENGYVFPMEGPGLGTERLPKVYERSDLTVRRTEA